MFRISRNRRVVRAVAAVLMAMAVIWLYGSDPVFAALSTDKQWGSDITDAKLNKYNGKKYTWKLPGVNQYACTGYTEWALNSVYGVKVPGYAATRALREYFIKKGNKIVAYGSHVAKAQGGNGKYYSYGEVKPGDIVFFFKRGANKKGKVTKSAIKDSRGYTNVSGWRHVAIVGGSISGSHGIKSKLHHNTRAKGIHYGGSIHGSISSYGSDKGATDYQVMRVINPEKVKRPLKIIKRMKVNGNVAPEVKAVFRIWPEKYGKYSSKSSWWKKIPGEYKDQVTTGNDGTGQSKALPTAAGDFNGKYYIYQTKGPPGVKIAKNKSVTLKKGKTVVEWTFTDESSEHPTIAKKDAETGNPVTQAGITFRLKQKGAFQKLIEYISEKEPDEDEARAIVEAFLSDDPAAGLGEIGAEIENAEWKNIGGADAFVTDDSGEAEIKTVRKENIGEYEVYETVSPEEFKLPGYYIAAVDPESASDLDRPVPMSITSELSTVTVEYLNMPEPELETEASDEVTKGHFGCAAEDAVIADSVSLENLEPGKTYTIFGRLMFKDTGEPVKDERGKEIRVIHSFTAEEKNGTEVLKFSLDGRSAGGRDIVVFERLYEGEYEEEPEETEPLAVHEDIEDEAQTVSYPEGHTEAKDSVTGTHSGTAAKEALIVDTFYYENLEPGKEYTLSGTLYDKDSGKAVMSGGKKVTAEEVFMPEERSGEVEIEYSLDASDMDGDSLVAGEVLKLDGNTVLEHLDLDDEAQTVTYPEKPEKKKKKKKPTVKDKPSEKPPSRKTSSPKTGDDKLELLVLFVTVLLASVVLLAIMALYYRSNSVKGMKNRKE